MTVNMKFEGKKEGMSQYALMDIVETWEGCTPTSISFTFLLVTVSFF